MNLQEIFEQNGLSAEVVTAILNAMKENKIFTASEENLDVRYGKLKTEHETKLSELEQANTLIGELKKSTKGNEDLQTKISTYENETIPALQKELEETKIKSAIKLALVSEKALDVDYLTFKLNEKMKESGETLTLDENENIKGWAEKLASLKTQFPTQFETSTSKKYDPNTLPNGNANSGVVTKEQFRNMSYSDRVKLKQENEALYKQLSN